MKEPTKIDGKKLYNPKQGQGNYLKNYSCRIFIVL